MRMLVIRNGTVVNVVEIDPALAWTPPDGATLEPAVAGVDIGHRRTAEGFAPPPPEPEPEAGQG